MYYNSLFFTLQLAQSRRQTTHINVFIYTHIHTYADTHSHTQTEESCVLRRFFSTWPGRLGSMSCEVRGVHTSCPRPAL